MVISRDFFLSFWLNLRELFDFFVDFKRIFWYSDWIRETYQVTIWNINYTMKKDDIIKLLYFTIKTIFDNFIQISRSAWISIYSPKVRANSDDLKEHDENYVHLSNHLVNWKGSKRLNQTPHKKSLYINGLTSPWLWLWPL